MNEPLWSDDKIDDEFLDVGFSEYAADAFTTALECAKRMREAYEAKIAELEKQVKAFAQEREEIGRAYTL